MLPFLTSGLVASTKSLFCKTFRSFGINDYCNNYFKIHFKEHNVLNFNIKHLNCLDVTLKLDSIQFKFFQSRSRISFRISRKTSFEISQIFTDFQLEIRVERTLSPNQSIMPKFSTKSLFSWANQKPDKKHQFENSSQAYISYIRYFDFSFFVEIDAFITSTTFPKSPKLL